MAQLVRQTTAVALVMLFLVGCGAGSPVPTAIPATSLPATPKAGEWQGDSIYFRVTPDGKLSGFSWRIQPSGPYDPCPIQFNEDMLITDGIFELTAEKKAGGTAYDFVVRFDTETTASLSYLYEMCPSTASVTFGQEGAVTFEGTAAAQWVKP